MAKVITPALVMALALVLSGCARHTEFRPGTGSVVDAVSTYHALTAYDMIEFNPALAWISDPAGIALASIAFKHGGKHLLYQGGFTQCQATTWMETSGWLAGGWNIGLMAGASTGGAALAGIAAAGLYNVIVYDPDCGLIREEGLEVP